MTIRILAFATVAAYASTSFAQVSPFPPRLASYDENNVDLLSGSLRINLPLISIGDQKGSNLTHSMSLQTFSVPLAGLGIDYGDFLGNNWDLYLSNECVTNTYTKVRYYVATHINLGEERGDFNIVGSHPAAEGLWCYPGGQTSPTFSPAGNSGGMGFRYDPANARYILTTRSGDTVEYDPNIKYFPVTRPNLASAYATKIIRKNGEIINLYYKFQINCDLQSSACPVPASSRLQSVVSSRGWMLKYGYATASSTDRLPITIKAINLSNGYCDPAGDNCSTYLELQAVNVQYIYSNSRISQVRVTDSTGSITIYNMASNGGSQISSMETTSGNIINYQYDANKRVTSVTSNGKTWSYSYTDDQPPPYTTLRTVTVTAPNGAVDTYTGTYPYIKSHRDALNRQTLYEHNITLMKLSKVTFPEGNYTTYTYDSRANLIGVAEYPKPGSGEAVRTYTRNFDADCTNPKTCNQPNWETDPAGNRTDYTYDSPTGLPTAVTGPAPSGGGARPQKRTAYSDFQAYFTNSAGAIVVSGNPITLPVSETECATQSSCAGTSDERRTDYDYGPQTTGVGNNLLLRSATDTGGGVSLRRCYSYDGVGNMTSATEPRAGLPGCL